tara:strand:+ start:141371 stop:141484 length:114 start_codon:yes stop_codon:yes gene_type:complete
MLIVGFIHVIKTLINHFLQQSLYHFSFLYFLLMEITF